MEAVSGFRSAMIRAVDWGATWTVGGISGSWVPVRLAELIDASDDEAAENAFDHLDNFIEIQGSVFSAAVPSVAILLSALLFEELAPPARLQILRLRWMMSNGETDPEEIARGNNGVAADVDRELAMGFWAFASWIHDPEFEIRRYCVELMAVASGHARDRMLKVVGESHGDPAMRAWARTILRRNVDYV